MRFQNCSLERPGATPVGVREVNFPDPNDPDGTIELVEPEDLGDVMIPHPKRCTLVVRGLSLEVVVSGELIGPHSNLAYDISIVGSLESRMELLKIATEVESMKRPRRRVTRKMVREVDRVPSGRGTLEREGAEPVNVTYDEFRIDQEFLEGEVAGLFHLSNGTIVLDEADPSLFALLAGNESCRLVLASGLSLEINIMSGDLMEGTRWAVMVMGDSIKELLNKSLERIKSLRSLYSYSEPPAALVETVQTITAELIKHLAKHPEELYEIKPRQFEELIAEILASYGWQVQLTKATRDGGYDLFAISKDQAGVETSWLIECKRYRKDRTIGIDVARALYGVRNVAMPAGMLMLATTSYFSQEVQALKASRYDLELKDYEGILEWVNEYRPNPDGRLYIKDKKLVLPGD